MRHSGVSNECICRVSEIHKEKNDRINIQRYSRIEFSKTVKWC
jgi:hypothetical protein